MNAQSSDSTINRFIFNSIADTIPSLNIKTDTAKFKLLTFPLLKLKSEIPLSGFDIKSFWKIQSDNSYLSDLTDEEKQSGLSKDQLIAYKKNKETLMKILAADYKERWWYHVKGLDELLGIPKEVIWALEFAMMFLLQ